MRLLERFALHRPELRAWAMYDWANSAFWLIVVTAVYPIYYRQVAAGGLDGAVADARFAWTTTAALTLVAVAAPVLGALGDFLARRKQLMALFIGLGVAATAAMGLVGEGDWALALVLFAVGNVAVSVSFVFYDALLPHIAAEEEMDRVSTAGYALGYLGSGLLMIVLLVVIQRPSLLGLADGGAATRFSFVAVAVWWAVFSLPVFRRVPEPPRQVETDETAVADRGAAAAVRVAFTRLGETFRELRGSYGEAFKMLLAMLVYNDGVGTIIRMAGLYAAGLGLPQAQVVTAILLVQFVGVPCAMGFGQVAARIGAKRAILIAVGVYCGISLFAYRLDTIEEFYVLAILVGTVQGGAQALSRSLFAGMIPKHKTAEFFGFFSVFEKFAGIFGPAIFSVMISLTGSSRSAILSIAVFFVVGGALLLRVDVDRGRREARAADARLVATLAGA